MVHEAQVTPKFQRAPWSAEAAAGLSECFSYDRELIEAGVKNGTLSLWRVNCGAAWMVTRQENGELIICCFQGSGLRDVAPVLAQRAREGGLHAVRFYTARPALARLLAEWNFRAVETVYRCEL